MIDYKKQNVKDLECLFEINANKINSYEKDKNKPPFITGVIKDLKKQNLQIFLILIKKYRNQ